MARKPWADLSRREFAVLAVVGLILGGLLVRNVVDAESAEEAVRSVAAVAVLGLLFGYRIVSRHLPARRDGALLLLVGGLAAGILVVVFPESFDTELVVAFGALALLGAALVVGSRVDLSTRAFGGALAVAGGGIVAGGLTVFDGDGVVLGGLLALLGVLTVVDPDGLESVERRLDR